MENEVRSPTDELRLHNRECIRELRKGSRSTLLRHRRLKLFEVEQKIQDLSLNQFKELLLELKGKKCSVATLKRIKNACIHEECIEAFLRADSALDALICAVLCSAAEKQLEAVGCLVNLACGQHRASCKIARKCGAYLVAFISGGSHFLQDLSAWAVGNLTLHCTECFHLLKAQGILPALSAAIKSPCESVVQSVAFALNACVQHLDPDLPALVGSDLTEHLLDLVCRESTPPPVLMDCSFILAKFCYLGVLNHLDFINVSTAERIFSCVCKQMRDKDNPMVLVPLLRCLGYLLCEESLCQHLLQEEPLYECLNEWMDAKYAHLRSETLWILTNILSSKACDINLLYAALKTDNMEALWKTEKSLRMQVIYLLTALASRDPHLPKSLCLVQEWPQSEDPSVRDALEVFSSVVNPDTSE